MVKPPSEDADAGNFVAFCPAFVESQISIPPLTNQVKLEDRIMTNWHDRFFAVADLIGSWSKDPSTQVGAVIIRPDRTIASVGYNGFPRGVIDVYQTREDKLLRTVHAEANAILTAREPLHGYSLYVTPLHPCANCAGLIIQSGIKLVHYKSSATSSSAWQTHFDAMQDMFTQAAITCFEHTIDCKGGNM